MIKINHQILPFFPLKQGQRYTFPLDYRKIKIFFFSLITSYSVYFILYGYSIVSFKFCQVSFPHSVICNLPLFPFDNFIFLYYNFYK